LATFAASGGACHDGRVVPVLTLAATSGTLCHVNSALGQRTKSRAEQLVERRHGASAEVLIRRLYVNEGLSQEQVADALGIGRRTVIRWMADFGIPTRDRRKVAA
jgi:transcriptional regulator with PAS, ATPase and Fis domain